MPLFPRGTHSPSALLMADGHTAPPLSVGSGSVSGWRSPSRNATQQPFATALRTPSPQAQARALAMAAPRSRTLVASASSPLLAPPRSLSPSSIRPALPPRREAHLPDPTSPPPKLFGHFMHAHYSRDIDALPEIGTDAAAPSRTSPKRAARSLAPRSLAPSHSAHTLPTLGTAGRPAVPAQPHAHGATTSGAAANSSSNARPGGAVMQKSSSQVLLSPVRNAPRTPSARSPIHAHSAYVSPAHSLAATHGGFFRADSPNKSPASSGAQSRQQPTRQSSDQGEGAHARLVARPSSTPQQRYPPQRAHHPASEESKVSTPLAEADRAPDALHQQQHQQSLGRQQSQLSSVARSNRYGDGELDLASDFDSAEEDWSEGEDDDGDDLDEAGFDERYDRYDYDDSTLSALRNPAEAEAPGQQTAAAVRARLRRRRQRRRQRLEEEAKQQLASGSYLAVPGMHSLPSAGNASRARSSSGMLSPSSRSSGGGGAGSGGVVAFSPATFAVHDDSVQSGMGSTAHIFPRNQAQHDAVSHVARLSAVEQQRRNEEVRLKALQVKRLARLAAAQEAVQRRLAHDEEDTWIVSPCTLPLDDGSAKAVSLSSKSTKALLAMRRAQRDAQVAFTSTVVPNRPVITPLAFPLASSSVPPSPALGAVGTASPMAKSQGASPALQPQQQQQQQLVVAPAPAPLVIRVPSPSPPPLPPPVPLSSPTWPEGPPNAERGPQELETLVAAATRSYALTSWLHRHGKHGLGGSSAAGTGLDPLLAHRYTEAFASLDNTGSGQISADTIAAALRRTHGISLPPEELDALLVRLKLAGTNTLSPGASGHAANAAASAAAAKSKSKRARLHKGKTGSPGAAGIGPRSRSNSPARLARGAGRHEIHQQAFVSALSTAGEWEALLALWHARKVAAERTATAASAAAAVAAGSGNNNARAPTPSSSALSPSHVRRSSAASSSSGSGAGHPRAHAQGPPTLLPFLLWIPAFQRLKLIEAAMSLSKGGVAPGVLTNAELHPPASATPAEREKARILREKEAAIQARFDRLLRVTHMPSGASLTELWEATRAQVRSELDDWAEGREPDSGFVSPDLSDYEGGGGAGGNAGSESVMDTARIFALEEAPSDSLAASPFAGVPQRTTILDEWVPLNPLDSRDASAQPSARSSIQHSPQQSPQIAPQRASGSSVVGAAQQPPSTRRPVSLAAPGSTARRGSNHGATARATSVVTARGNSNSNGNSINANSINTSRGKPITRRQNSSLDKEKDKDKEKEKEKEKPALPQTGPFGNNPHAASRAPPVPLVSVLSRIKHRGAESEAAAAAARLTRAQRDRAELELQELALAMQRDRAARALQQAREEGEEDVDDEGDTIPVLASDADDEDEFVLSAPPPFFAHLIESFEVRVQLTYIGPRDQTGQGGTDSGSGSVGANAIPAASESGGWRRLPLPAVVSRPTDLFVSSIDFRDMRDATYVDPLAVLDRLLPDGHRGRTGRMAAHRGTFLHNQQRSIDMAAALQEHKQQLQQLQQQQVQVPKRAPRRSFASTLQPPDESPNDEDEEEEEEGEEEEEDGAAELGSGGARALDPRRATSRRATAMLSPEMQLEIDRQRGRTPDSLWSDDEPHRDRDRDRDRGRERSSSSSAANQLDAHNATVVGRDRSSDGASRTVPRARGTAAEAELLARGQDFDGELDADGQPLSPLVSPGRSRRSTGALLRAAAAQARSSAAAAAATAAAAALSPSRRLVLAEGEHQLSFVVNPIVQLYRVDQRGLADVVTALGVVNSHGEAAVPHANDELIRISPHFHLD